MVLKGRVAFQPRRRKPERTRASAPEGKREAQQADLWTSSRFSVVTPRWLRSSCRACLKSHETVIRDGCVSGSNTRLGGGLGKGSKSLGRAEFAALGVIEIAISCVFGHVTRFGIL
jgi:hypothetical protein